VVVPNPDYLMIFQPLESVSQILFTEFFDQCEKKLHRLAEACSIGAIGRNRAAKRVEKGN
jgi:hypothetical protein